MIKALLNNQENNLPLVEISKNENHTEQWKLDRFIYKWGVWPQNTTNTAFSKNLKLASGSYWNFCEESIPHLNLKRNSQRPFEAFENTFCQKKTQQIYDFVFSFTPDQPHRQGEHFFSSKNQLFPLFQTF